MPTATIRPVRPEEYDEVGRLLVAAYDSVGTIEGRYRSFMADTGARVADGAEVLVAEVDERVVGTVTFADSGNAHHEHGPHSDCGFRLLGVDPEAHGQGYGRQLVEYCIDHARRLGRLRLMIYSVEWMRPAHRLYESMGFQRRPDRDVVFPAGVGLAFQYDLVEGASDHFPPPGPVPEEPPWHEDVL